MKILKDDGRGRNRRGREGVSTYDVCTEKGDWLPQ